MPDLNSTADVSLPLLIGGAPCAGKSTVAKALAEEKSVTWASTDELREVVQKQPNAEHHYPWLFFNSQMTAEEYWKDHQPEDVLQLEIDQGRELWSMLQKAITEHTYGIFEGVSILPEFVWNAFGERIRAVFIIDPNQQRVRETIYQRGLWGDANTYADWIKPKEVEWVMLHNQWLRDELKKYPYPLVEVGDRDKLLEQVKHLIS